MYRWRLTTGSSTPCGQSLSGVAGEADRSTALSFLRVMTIIWRITKPSTALLDLGVTCVFVAASVTAAGQANLQDCREITI
jgi:hypothetical protein